MKYGPGDYVPLMVVTYWGFRLMMTAGLLMMALAAFFLWALRGKIETRPMAKVGAMGDRPAVHRQHQRLDPDRDGPPAVDRAGPADRQRRHLTEPDDHGSCSSA